MRLATYLSMAALAQLGLAGYTVKDDYSSASHFFDKFDFFTEADPTNGYVKYVDRKTANNLGIVSGNAKGTKIGVDSKNKASGSGRQSVRLTSKASYNHGLVILDLNHMPGGACGSWPAFWMLGSGTWPNNGEIDIIEGVNDQTKNQMALHTTSGCSIDKSGFKGKLGTSNCDVKASGQSDNEGCTITAGSTKSYGSGFNSGNGGVYATEWTSDAINIWFFPHSNIPSDIANKKPTPSSWGQPTAKYAGDCKIDSHFKNMNIVFDVTFCGDWAGNTWSSSSCASKANTCQDYVANNPSAFKDTYWGINSLLVYEDSSNSKREEYDYTGLNVTSPLPRTGEAARRHAIRHGAHGRHFH
ncbi:hypothetical protein ASPWEDRAFT_105915 [Aspergillus wentii DTO 134E9]|uniref:endo-1,3(4)-beta-glucanase n=1 Tax=Aspergillus wentii DTO 134E9 TaxID=1073089 RepID=A0A1L9RY10_ASPWE|nr:uncharacterized protein ASPWEDRAFT_105915 [Aspergillus wentii DTO 134E9]KAI9931601.1 hypothetical protein MW887_010178 [Aspergillus wentii]OJJ39728.1 hypothetical protein ASPWEDRAFT_105915 [Aspergillus wentii DTO 134E9]